MTNQSQPTTISGALHAMWSFASKLVEKHGMDGDNSLSDAEHAEWQDVSGTANHLLAQSDTAAIPHQLFYLEVIRTPAGRPQKKKAFLASAKAVLELDAENQVRAAVAEFLAVDWEIVRCRKISDGTTAVWQEIMM